MTDTKPTYNEAVEALNGYDELAIQKKFGNDLDSLLISMQLRALVFVDRQRAGAKENDAYKAAMELTVKQLGDEFADEEPEVVPDEPITEQGKDDSAAT